MRVLGAYTMRRQIDASFGVLGATKPYEGAYVRNQPHDSVLSVIVSTSKTTLARAGLLSHHQFPLSLKTKKVRVGKGKAPGAKPGDPASKDPTQAALLQRRESVAVREVKNKEILCLCSRTAQATTVSRFLCFCYRAVTKVSYILGVTKALARTKGGEAAMVYLEAEDSERIVPTLVVSEQPFDLWFKERLLECYGRDLMRAPGRVAAKLIFAYRDVSEDRPLVSGEGPS